MDSPWDDILLTGWWKHQDSEVGYSHTVPLYPNLGAICNPTMHGHMYTVCAAAVTQQTTSSAREGCYMLYIATGL